MRTVLEDGFYKLENAVDSMIHFMHLSYVREKVLAEQVFNRYDADMCKYYISKQGVQRCEKLYKELFWSAMINPHDPQERTNGECYKHLLEITGHRGGEARDRSRRWFAATCHRRFGGHALKWYWTMGFMNEHMVEALNRVAARRTEENRQRAQHSGAPEPAVGETWSRQHALARRDARRFANLEKRWLAAEAPAGPCQAQTCRWSDWPNWDFPVRVQCLRCGTFVCLDCQPREHSGSSADPAVEYFLLCPACFETHGRELPVLGRIEDRPAPDKCDNDEDNTHRPGPFLQCRFCNRWLCADCARDDGPPHACSTLVN